ncbi:unnamed protein product [Rangifer tarandus platyrhynchus]|uniref:Uncharacterized protein n=2 Tax=Rangifer tarandus platyrhynchus TaxID=3082113 RepID=A0ABN8ZIY7_RANTA|nr:unnamed protein product [Rangifer tarandus platyrhynchus]CAI9708239.1 unnamed protein product [Rangifer tarandus platyrhynchus]
MASRTQPGASGPIQTSTQSHFLHRCSRNLAMKSVDSLRFWDPGQVKLALCGPRHQDGLCQACGLPVPAGQSPSCAGAPRAPEFLLLVQVSDQSACHLLPALLLLPLP